MAAVDFESAYESEKEAYLTMVQVAATQLSAQFERSKAQTELQQKFSALKRLSHVS